MKSLFFLYLMSHFLMAGEPKGWQLVWKDEFDGAQLDYTKWAVEENGHGGGNQELQYYLDRQKNVRVENGNLVLQAHRETVNVAGVVREYTSGRVRTKRRAAWQYGRFEIRARLPKGRGLWPAIWLLPETTRYGGWAASGEIDIVEALGHEPDRVHGSIHYGGEWPNNKHTSATYRLPGENIADDFHTYTCEWEPGEIRWYVDGHLYQTLNKWHSTAGAYPAPFDQPFHLVLNLAVGGKWPGAPDKNTVFPALLQVDYVRVYQREKSEVAPTP